MEEKNVNTEELKDKVAETAVEASEKLKNMAVKLELGKESSTGLLALIFALAYMNSNSWLYTILFLIIALVLGIMALVKSRQWMNWVWLAFVALHLLTFPLRAMFIVSRLGL